MNPNLTLCAAARKVSRNQLNLLIQYGYFRRENGASPVAMQN